MHTENATQAMYTTAMWSMVAVSIAKGDRSNGPPEVLLLKVSIVRCSLLGKETYIESEHVSYKPDINIPSNGVQLWPASWFHREHQKSPRYQVTRCARHLDLTSPLEQDTRTNGFSICEVFYCSASQPRLHHTLCSCVTHTRPHIEWRRETSDRSL